jgi:hypothetical protein
MPVTQVSSSRYITFFTQETRENTMMTVRETLMSKVLTDVERDLLDRWFDDTDEPVSSRRRAWDEVARRARSGQPDLLVRW